MRPDHQMRQIVLEQREEHGLHESNNPEVSMP